MIPERVFGSAEEMLAHYKAVRARSGMDVRRPVVIQRPPPAPPPEAEPEADPSDPERLPVWVIINRIAVRHGLRTSDILGPSKLSHIVVARWRAIADIHKAYPDKSLSWIGKKVGLDHTSVINALQRLGIKRARLPGTGRPKMQPMPEEEFAEAVAMYQSGLSQKKIADHFGTNETRIYKLFKAQGIKKIRVMVVPS